MLYQLTAFDVFVCVCPPALPLWQLSGISFIAPTSLKICHNRHIKQHAKTSVDWFFGFKLQVVVNDKGELLNFTLTPGNTDDREGVSKLLRRVFGKVFADKGYVSAPLAKQLFQQMGVQLLTKVRRNMKQRLGTLNNRLLLHERSTIEPIIDQLKNISQIEHSRHRSPLNFLVNLVAGLIAYCHQPKKPSIALDNNFLHSA
jgi:transposase